MALETMTRKQLMEMIKKMETAVFNEKTKNKSLDRENKQLNQQVLELKREAQEKDSEIKTLRNKYDRRTDEYVASVKKLSDFMESQLSGSRSPRSPPSPRYDEYDREGNRYAGSYH